MFWFWDNRNRGGGSYEVHRELDGRYTLIDEIGIICKSCWNEDSFKTASSQNRMVELEDNNLELQITNTKAKSSCTCDFIDLLKNGCSCGSITRYKIEF